MEKCRLCLSENSNLSDVSELREGLPLSVIAMIICPIKIESDDNLPKQICGDCIEIIITAYQLRDTSNQNDRYLREHSDWEPIIKKEILEENEPIFFQSSIYEDTRSDAGLELPQTTQSIVEPYTGFKVDCYKNDNRSFVWKYFGTLTDDKGNHVDKDFFYCTFCVKKGLLTKYRKHNATTCFSRHLQRLHNIIDKKVVIKKPALLTICTCDVCGVRLSSKEAMEKHMQSKHITVFEHPALPRTNFVVGEFLVDCHKAGKSANTSWVWNYFGKLVNPDGVEVNGAEGFNFCRVCVEEKNKLTKLAVSNATSGLMHHLTSKHGLTANGKDETKIISIKKEIISSSVHKNPSDYRVNCYRASVNKSFAWNFIGMLTDVNNQPVESETEFMFCKLCVEKGNVTKKFKKTCATTNFLFHLKTTHGVTSDKTEANQSLMEKKDLKTEGKTCTICNESFETRKAYFNHLRNEHKEIEPSDYICHVCSKSFTKNYILAKHMRIHSGVDHSCSLCPATFNYPEGLKRHEKIHDPAHFSKYQCDQCLNSYAEMKSLRTHIYTVHLNKAKDRNHFCDICEMTFVTACNLKRHVMKHTGEKPHECEYCDAAYTQKGDLVKHLQKAHNTMYSCAHQDCKASFRLQVDLREHYRVHSKKNEEESQS